MVYQTSDNDMTKSFRDLIANGSHRNNEVIHAAGDNDITKSFRDLIAEGGKHSSEISSVEHTMSTLVAMGFESSHAKKALIDNDGNLNQAIIYLVARSNNDDAAGGTNHHESAVVAEDLATSSSLSGATTIIADADLAVLVTNAAASAASDPALTAPPDIEAQRPPPRMERQIVVDDKCFCITCTPCIGVTFSIFLAIGCMLLVGATAYFFGRLWGLLALVGYWTIMCCGMCGCIDNLVGAFSRDGCRRVFNF